MQESEQLEKQFEHEMEKEYSFLRTLMEIELKIEHLDQKVKKNVKEKRNIEKSHSWRYSKPLRMFHASEEDHYNLDLQADIYHLKEELRYLSLQIERQDPEQMFGYLKEAKKSGEIFQHLESLLKQKRESDTFYSAIFKYIASLYKNEKAEYRDLVYNKLLSGLSVDHVPEIIVRAGEGCDSLSLKQVASFQTSLNLRARRGQLGESLPEKLLDKKEIAYRFVDKLGVRRPWTGNDTFRGDEIPKKKEIVIKPLDGAGSRGVYLILDFDKIIDVKRQRTLKNLEMLQESMKEDITFGWVKQDEWLMEELIYDSHSLATDLKFYCFYGEVGLILEITRVPELKYCWWSAKGKRIRTGKYDEDLYKGQGVTEQEIKLASDISTQIPAPFVRVDFLRSANGLVFGEFTPKPGNYDEFDKKTDQLLGDYYLEAESRLTEDLLEGKQFKPYTEIKKRFHL